MNREKLKQLTIKSWKEDCEDMDRFSSDPDPRCQKLIGSFLDYRGLKVDNFFCEKMGKDIDCTLTFKDSAKTYGLTVTPSVSFWDEVK